MSAPSGMSSKNPTEETGTAPTKRAPRSTKFQPTEEGYTRLLELLNHELENPVRIQFRGGKSKESSNGCQMCGPLSTGAAVTQQRDAHKQSDVEDLPNNHPLRPLLSYANSEGLPARISHKPRCPSYGSLIVGDLSPLTDDSRVDFERNSKWPEAGNSSSKVKTGVSRPSWKASAKDRWNNQSKRITEHHIRLVQDTLDDLRAKKLEGGEKLLELAREPSVDFTD